MSQPPALLTIIARAIHDKTGDDHAARREVAEAVREALQIEARRCPVCGVTGYASRNIAATCKVCSQPMQPQSLS